MLHHLITATVFGNESPDFYILYRNLLLTNLTGNHLLQLLFIKVITPAKNPFYFNLIQVIFHTLHQTIKSNFGCIWYVRKDTVLQIIINPFQYPFAQMITKRNPFSINLFVATPAKIDSFKATSPTFFGRHHLTNTKISLVVYNQCIARHQLFYFILTHIEGSADTCPFTCCNNYLVIYIIIGRTNAMCVSKYKTMTVSN